MRGSHEQDVASDRQIPRPAAFRVLCIRQGFAVLGGGKTAELHLAIPWGETNSKRSVPLTQSCGTDSGRAMASLACSNRVPKGPVAGGNVIHPILS